MNENMLDRTQLRTFYLAAACGLAFLAGPAAACNTPVFRYALERWEPDIYGVLVFHEGPLDANAQKAVDFLKKAAADRDTPCNMDVLTVDVSGEIPETVKEVWEQHKGKPLPRMVAFYPRRFGPAVVAWAGPVTEADARALLDSPTRQAIYKHIVSGASAVWVLLEGGEKAKDDAAAQLIQKQLKTMETELELPPQAPDPFGPPEPEGGPPLKISFPLVRLPRQAPGEQAFVQMLLNTEADLKTEYAGEPMAFAVFGQGRAMWGLVGKGINADNVAEVCAFLVGRCSCQVKEQNPGIDMLIAADWYAAFGPGEAVTAPLATALIAPEPDTQPATQPAAAAATEKAIADAAGSSGSLARNTVIALACVGLLAVALVVWAGRRTARA